MDFLRNLFVQKPKIDQGLSHDEIANKHARLAEIEKQLMEIQSGVLKAGHSWDTKSSDVASLHSEELEIQKELAPYIKEAA